MKRLYIIGGTMGIGKTTVSKVLNKKLANSVFLDGDWCWNMDPFVVNEETKALVLDNICCLLNNFINCTVFDNIIFCWVLHQQDTIDELLTRINLENVDVKVISLVCNQEALIKRLQQDIDQNIRTNDVIERSLERLKHYQNLNTIKIDVSNLTVNQTVAAIERLSV
ncbi:MAG: AAA family ATPase [Thomasclavelia sp.]